MNWFGNTEKDYLMDEIERFLSEYPVSELLEIVKCAVEQHEQMDNK